LTLHHRYGARPDSQRCPGSRCGTAAFDGLHKTTGARLVRRASGKDAPRERLAADPNALRHIRFANWANKADLGVVVHRDPNQDPTKTEIHVRKVRFKSVGKVGFVALRWDPVTGRYSEIARPSRAYAAME
jgi:hypothetical protein